MKAGQLTTVKVEDVTFLVRFNWGALKALAKQFGALDSQDMDAFDKLLAEHVLPAVVKVDGLTDANDLPVETLTTAILDEYPPDLTMGLIQGLLDVGKRLSSAAVPPA